MWDVINARKEVLEAHQKGQAIDFQEVRFWDMDMDCRDKINNLNSKSSYTACAAWQAQYAGIGLSFKTIHRSTSNIWKIGQLCPYLFPCDLFTLQFLVHG